MVGSLEVTHFPRVAVVAASVSLFEQILICRAVYLMLDVEAFLIESYR